MNDNSKIDRKINQELNMRSAEDKLNYMAELDFQKKSL